MFALQFMSRYLRV